MKYFSGALPYVNIVNLAEKETGVLLQNLFNNNELSAPYMQKQATVYHNNSVCWGYTCACTVYPGKMVLCIMKRMHTHKKESDAFVMFWFQRTETPLG